MAQLKEQLYLLCRNYISTREAEIKKVIEEAQDAAAGETKSSAGDKYETGREVMQQEINLNITRLNELHKLSLTLDHISPTQKGDKVVAGSLIYTNHGAFYISVSAGQLVADGLNFYAISAASPLGVKMLGKHAGHTFELNGKTFEIEKVS